MRALQDRNPDFGVHAFRPGGILPDETNKVLRFLLAPIVVSVGELADAMIEAASDARLFRQRPIIGNNNIKLLAKRRLPLTAR